MAFAELPPDPNFTRAAESYRKGMKDLGRGLIFLAVLQLALTCLLLFTQPDMALVVVLGFLSAVHIAMGVLALCQQFWINYVVVGWATLIIVLNLVAVGKQAGDPAAGSNPGGCLGYLIMGALIYYANKNMKAYWAMKKSEREF